jgi:hypothetical protein
VVLLAVLCVGLLAVLLAALTLERQASDHLLVPRLVALYTQIATALTQQALHNYGARLLARSCTSPCTAAHLEHGRAQGYKG